MKRYNPEKVQALLQEKKIEQNNIQRVLSLIEIHRTWKSLPSEELRKIPVIPDINEKSELILQCPNTITRIYVQGQLQFIQKHFITLINKLNVSSIRVDRYKNTQPSPIKNVISGPKTLHNK